MPNTRLGFIDNEEKAEILQLYKRKLALDELLLTLDSGKIPKKDKSNLCRIILDDFGQTNFLMDKWWHSISLKYDWTCSFSDNWSIDFNTNEIFLVPLR